MTTQIALTVRQRVQLIRKAVPHGNMLENLFKSQNSICDLCPHPIQDLICASLDHSTPVLFFARSDMPLGEAIAQANDPKNLRCVHASCNLAKGRRTREEWFAQGLNKREALRLLPDGELLLLAFKMGAGGRVGGRTCAKNKTGVCGQSLEKMSENGKKGGRKNVKSGHLTSIRGMGGLISGRRNVESGQLASIQTKENQSKGGRATNVTTNGRKSKGGRISGRKTVENGIGLYGRSPEKMSEDSRKGGRISMHNRWHVKSGISNPNCSLCQLKAA